jgi:hypothetical protein
MPNNDKLKAVTQQYSGDWKSKGFNPALQREERTTPFNQYSFIGGANFDAQLDEMLFNRMIKLKDMRIQPQGNDPGKIYWDGANKKYKIWVNGAGWCDVLYTSTSTTTSSSSTSSTSTSTT